MDKTKRVNGGFTLVEVIVAMLMATLVILALVGIFSSTLRWFNFSYRQNTIQSGTVLSFSQLSQDLGKTTFVSSPVSPCGGGAVCPPCPGGACAGSAAQGSDILQGCTNYDLKLGNLIDLTQKMRVYDYCVDAAGNMQYAWQDGNAPGVAVACPPVIAGACGPAMTINGVNQVMQLATGIQRDTTNNDCPAMAACGGGLACYFCRQAYDNNHLELHYWVSETQSTTTVKVNTSIATMMPSNPP